MAVLQMALETVAYNNKGSNPTGSPENGRMCTKKRAVEAFKCTLASGYSNYDDNRLIPIEAIVEPQSAFIMNATLRTNADGENPPNWTSIPQNGGDMWIKWKTSPADRKVYLGVYNANDDSPITDYSIDFGDNVALFSVQPSSGDLTLQKTIILRNQSDYWQDTTLPMSITKEGKTVPINLIYKGAPSITSEDMVSGYPQLSVSNDGRTVTAKVKLKAAPAGPVSFHIQVNMRYQGSGGDINPSIHIEVSDSAEHSGSIGSSGSPVIEGTPTISNWSASYVPPSNN